MRLQSLLKMIGRSINPTTVEEVEDAAEKLKEQKSVVQAYVMDEVFDKMSGGEAALAPYYAGDGITMAEDNRILQCLFRKREPISTLMRCAFPRAQKQRSCRDVYQFYV